MGGSVPAPSFPGCHLPLARQLVLGLEQGAPWTCHGVIAFAGVQGKEFWGCTGSVKDLMSPKRVELWAKGKEGLELVLLVTVLDQSRCVAALQFVRLLRYGS